MKTCRAAMLLTMLEIILGAYSSKAKAQEILKVLEPGIGYSQFKQWVSKSELVFEAFTKDSMVARDTGMRQDESIRIQIRFCGGDDYSGRASSITIQEYFQPKIDVVKRQRDYVEFLAGNANAEGKFEGTFSVRRDKKDGTDGLAIRQDIDTAFWDVGLFKHDDFALLQTTRRKDSICQ